jgi:hypothetical protein
MSSADWAFAFDAIQTFAVVFAVVFGAYELHALRRRQGWESLDKMFAEWRASLPLQEEALERMPLHTAPDVRERAVQLALELLERSESPSTGSRQECSELLVTGRNMVHALNDIGAFVERGSVSERDFFGQFHIRVLELGHLLEPLVLMMSACRGSRWGLRLRRLHTAAKRYHYASRIHRSLDVQVRGIPILEGKSAGRPAAVARIVRQQRLRWTIVPSKERCSVEEDALMAEVRERINRALAGRGMDCTDLLEALPVKV